MRILAIFHDTLLPLLFLMAGFLGSSQSIIEKPISFDEERKQLTLQYLKDRYGIIQEEPTIIPRMVVVHWTEIPTMAKTFDAFNPSTLPGARSGIASAGALNVSSQYLIDTDGIIYRLLPDTIMARHVIGLNHCAIGIENVGPNDEGTLSDEQLESNVWLIGELKKKYPIEYVIGHSEYTDWEGHPLWLEKDDGYRTQKRDPDSLFMRRLRLRLK